MVVLFVVVGAAVDVAFADVVVSVCLELWLFITKRQGEVTGIWQSNYLPGYIASNKWTQWIKRNLMKWIEMKWIVWAKLTSFLYHAIIPINYQMNSPRLNAIAGFWLINLNKYFIIRFLYLYVYLIFCTSLFVVTVVLCPFLQFNLIYVGDSSELIWMYTKLLPDCGDSVIVGSSDLLFLLQFYILQFWFVFFCFVFSVGIWFFILLLRMFRDSEKGIVGKPCCHFRCSPVGGWIQIGWWNDIWVPLGVAWLTRCVLVDDIWKMVASLTLLQRMPLAPNSPNCPLSFPYRIQAHHQLTFLFFFVVPFKLMYCSFNIVITNRQNSIMSLMAS